MSESGAEQEFEAAVEGWVTSALDVADFGDLVRALPGVDPVVALATLDRLAQSDNASADAARRLGAIARSTVPTARSTVERPVPHPLEFYWRNDDASLAHFCELLSTYGLGSTIAYLGMPNVFQLARASLPGRHHVMIDRSIPRMNVLATGEQAIRLDVLRETPPPLGADAVVTDPPWYPEHLRSFLWAAARLLKCGAMLYASLPPDGTRPGVVHERAELLEWARHIGFELMDYEVSALRYVSSPFELASHRAAAIGGIPLDWRCGDLGVLRLVEKRDAPRPVVPEDEGRWLTFTIDEIPVWVRDRDPDDGPLTGQLLASLLDGDVLATVSRRDPRRARIDVWTSLNRVYTTTHPAAVQAVCRALAEREDPVMAVAAELERALSPEEENAVVETTARLERIVAEERSIHRLDDT
jgi:hypothetical protein